MGCLIGKLRYSPHRTDIVYYATHRGGSGIVWVLDIDTLDTYSDLFHIKSWYYFRSIHTRVG